MKKVLLLVGCVWLLTGCQVIDNVKNYINESNSEHAGQNIVISKDDPIEIVDKKTNYNGITFRISPQQLTLSIGHSEKIKIIALPRGYKYENLKIYSQDENIAKINPRTGEIYAIGSGNTVIILETKDKKYDAKISVSVTKDFSLDWDKIF